MTFLSGKKTYKFKKIIIYYLPKKTPLFFYSNYLLIMNSAYFSKNKAIVDQMIEKENTFVHPVDNSSANNIISDVGLFRYSPSFEMEYCIFDLIKAKKEVKRYYNSLAELDENRQLLPELWNIVNDFSETENKFVTPPRSDGTEVFVDTTLIIVNKMDDHIWKKVHKTYYKKDLKVAFPSSVKQIDSIMKDNFKKANKYDAVIVRVDKWIQMVPIRGLFVDNHHVNAGFRGYKGYTEDIEFRFKRVVFATQPNFHPSYPGFHCPFANFSWFDASDALVNVKDKCWNRFFPKYERRVLPWNKPFKATIRDALSVVAKQHNSNENIRCICPQTFDDFDYEGGLNFIEDELQNDPGKLFLYVTGYEYANTSLKYMEKYFKRKHIRCKTVKSNTRIYKEKILNDNIQVLLVSANEMYRKDLNLDIVDEIVFVDGSMNQSYTHFIEKCFPFRRENARRQQIDVIMSRPFAFRASENFRLRHNIRSMLD